MSALCRLLSKEPVLLGAAVVAVFEAAAPDASSAWKLAIGAVVAWCVRILSTPEQRAKERVAEAEQNGYRQAEDAVRALRPLRGR